MGYALCVFLNRKRLVALSRARHRLSNIEPDAADARPVTIAELACEAGMSTGLFIRAFRSLFGQTPHQHRITTRLEHAKRLLADGRDVTSVCFDVGWSSLGSFSHTFRRRVGVSPAHYREHAIGARRVAGEPHVVTSHDVHTMGCTQLMTLARSCGE